MYRNYGYGFDQGYFYTAMEPEAPEWPSKILFYKFTTANQWSQRYNGRGIDAYTLSRAEDTNLYRETVDFELVGSHARAVMISFGVALVGATNF